MLSPSEIKDLETQAQASTNEGRLHWRLQARNAQATKHGRTRSIHDIMGIASKPGARDGFVAEFNLQPGNLKQGQAILFAGQSMSMVARFPKVNCSTSMMK